KQLMRNVMINLLSNGSKYSGEDSVIWFSTVIRGNTITLVVRDEGIGIPDEDKTHLFTPFFRAQNVTNIQGTGLGLNIVKKYVEVMGGELRYESERGQGTTFTITLPYTAQI